MEETKPKKKVNFRKEYIYIPTISLLVAFALYQNVSLDFHKVGNTIAMTYNFTLLDIKE